MDQNQKNNKNQMMDPRDKRIKELEEKINKLNIQLKEEQNKNFDLLKQNKNLQNKINNLEIQINNQNNNLMSQNNNNKMLKLFEKIEDLNINNLEIQINNQNNILMPQNNNNEMLKLYKKIEDLNEKLKRYPYILEKDEKLMSVIFTSVDQKTHYSLICKNTHTIHNLEPELYKEYPDYCYTEYYFMCKGKVINKFEKLENYHIKNGDIIILDKKE